MNTVLLAEDEPVSRRFLQDALEALGFHCEVVSDGRVALERATARRFDLLLLDVNLPELHGPDVLLRLRQTPGAASHHALAVALTADNETGVTPRLLRAGFAAVGTKPIGLDGLAALLNSVLPTGEPAPVSRSDLACWDDAAALSATGGGRSIVIALRELMLKELPAQRDAILAAIERDDGIAARDVLHRLRAACGFCGAAELSASVDLLHHGLEIGHADPAARSRFQQAIRELLTQDSI